MRVLSQVTLQSITGGCGETTCQQATLAFLESCSYDNMKKINQIFKSVVLSPDMKDADAETIRLAMIAAVKADFNN